MDFDLFASPAVNSEAVFGLTDNPFNPERFGNVDSRALDALDSAPLAIDEHPGLEGLFVAEAGPFTELIQRFAEKLRGGGFRSGENRRLGGKSFAFRVAGPQGSGKSTLASFLVAKIKQCANDGELLVVKRSAAASKVGDAIAHVRERAGAHGGPGCCVVFDDVTLAIEDQLHELYEDLRRHTTVVMLELIDNAEDIRRPLALGRVPTEHLHTSFLTSHQAASFVRCRVDLFRTDTARHHLPAALGSFPYDCENVGLSDPDPEVQQPLTLRTLGVILSEAFVRELTRRRPEEALTSLTEAQLRARLIGVADVYAEWIRDKLGVAA